MMKIRDVVAAIIEKDGNILLAQRPPGGDQAGLWEFPGGKVESGETQPEALARELEEELGIIATIGDYVASHRQQVSGRWIHLHAWHVTNYCGDIRALSHSEILWCPPAQAFNRQLAPADVPLLHAFMALYAAR